MTHHRQRGQILPLWSAAIVSTFVLMFLVINYGNTVRWQMRAQNAADAAAQALMAIQTQRFNELSASLYTANIEEYRTRALLDGLLNTLDGSAGCSGYPTMAAAGQAPFATGAGTCDQTYKDLLPAYVRATNRYTTDVNRTNDIASLATFDNWNTDINALLTHLSSSNFCNKPSAATVNPDGGDCAFQYTLNGSAVRTGLNGVSADAYIVFVPTQGFTLANNAETENPKYFDPGMVDVVVCTKVPPLIPTFGVLNGKTHYAIGRAGATAVLTEEDWLQPGNLQDPARNPQTQFQPKETYSNTDAASSYDWYGVYFGGNAWGIRSFINKVTGATDYGYVSYPVINDLSAYVGWWNAIPYDPRNVDANPVSVAKDCPP